MTPTPELRKLLLKELSTHHDLHRLCINWDIDDVNSYSLFSSPSQTPVPETNLQRYGTPHRTHHRFPTFG